MKNAESLLSNYKIPAGLEFKFLPGEEILIDSFSFKSAAINCSYVGFISNKRFIFKQTTFGAADEARHADMKFINWSDINGIVYGNSKIGFMPFSVGNFRLLGKVVDFSPEGESVNYELGVLVRGMGGLSYANKKDLEDVLLPTLKKMALEHKIPFGTTEEYRDFSTIGDEEISRITEKVNSLFIDSYKPILYVSGGIIVLLVIMILISLTSFTFVFLLSLAVIGGYFAYKKFFKS